ncbi:MAG: PQQ-binding-like beta-propeller repeat protein, partial [bacterium]|nr:PQQ-binding-like beta-propeller repeat protein [bacterium]
TIGVIFLLLYGIVGGAVEKSVGVVSKTANFEVSEKTVQAITRVAFYVVIFVILLIATQVFIGLPRAAAYFLASLVGKEPLRSFDFGYYFVSWIDYVKAIAIFASYIFFLLFVNSIGYLFLNEDVKAGEYEETKPVSEKKRKRANVIYVVALIICIYAVPATIAILFETVVVPDRTTAYNSLALDDESERLVWAELNNDGIPDPVVIGGNSGSPEVYAAALDGATGELVWYRELSGEWCDADVRSDGERIFTIVRNSYDSYDIVALYIADGSTAWRKTFSGEVLGAIHYGDQWTVRDGIIVFEETWNYGTIALRAGDSEPVSGVAPYKSPGTPYNYLDQANDGLYYIRRDDARLFGWDLDELDHQISDYYSLKMHDPEYFETYYGLAYSGEAANLIIANYKYKYGLIEGRSCDALYYFDGAGNFQWEFADGRLLSVEGVLGVNGPLVLIYGSDRNSLPLLAAVNSRDGKLLWTWNRYELIKPPLWERIKRRLGMIFG